MADLSNTAIADAFDELADLYELDGAVVHRVLAYRTAAKNVRDATVSVAELTQQGRVTTLPGIGKTLEEKIQAMVDTGTIPALGKLRDRIPPGPRGDHPPARRRPEARARDVRPARHRLDRRAARGGGDRPAARRARASARSSRRACSPRSTPGPPTGRRSARVLPTALEVGEQVAEALRAHPAAVHVEIAGSARRLADSVKDLDIVAAADGPGRAGRRAGRRRRAGVGGHAPGENAARGRAHNGLGIDLRVVEPDQFGNLLQHFTGSARHNVALREAAVRRGLHVSEYGILDDETGETMRCATEEEVYERLGLPWIPPELREDRGELAAGLRGPAARDRRGPARRSALPHDALRRPQHARGDGARRAGARLRVPRDHRPLGDARLRRPRDARRAAPPDRAGPRRSTRRSTACALLVGTETNILPDGRPDYDDELLAELDWVVGSVHTSFNMTERT